MIDPDDEPDLGLLPEEITVDDLLALPADALPRLSGRRSEMSAPQRESFEKASAELSRRFRRTIDGAELTPATRVKVQALIDDAAYPSALRDFAARVDQQYADRNRQLVAEASRAGLLTRNVFGQPGATQRRREPTTDSEGIPIDEWPAQPISPTQRQLSPSVADGAAPTYPTIAAIENDARHVAEIKSTLDELAQWYQAKDVADRRLAGLFWIVSVAAIVQGVSTIVSADSWSDRWWTVGISAVLLLVALAIMWFRRRRR